MRSDYVARPPSPLAGIALAMSDPAFELDANEAAAIFSAFAQARAAGHPFDPFTVALVDVLRRQLAATDEGLEDYQDGDAELCVDDGLEDDDTDTEEDGELYGVFCFGTRRHLTNGSGQYLPRRKARVA